jgi:hypothetical protein
MYRWVSLLQSPLSNGAFTNVLLGIVEYRASLETTAWGDNWATMGSGQSREDNLLPPASTVDWDTPQCPEQNSPGLRGLSGGRTIGGPAPCSVQRELKTPENQIPLCSHLQEVVPLLLILTPSISITLESCPSHSSQPQSLSRNQQMQSSTHLGCPSNWGHLVLSESPFVLEEGGKRLKF